MNTKTEDYFLAGKSVRFFPLMMTLLATQVGGCLILGAADEAFTFGWSVLFYPLGVGLGLIALGLGLGKKLAEFPVSTVAQVLEIVYRSPLLKKTASILSVISLFMVLVAQIIASHKFLIAIGATSLPLFLGLWGAVMLYVIKGGLKAVIKTDIVQAALFSLIFFFCFGWCFIAQGLPSFETFVLPTSKMTGWLLLPLLFMVIEQDMGQRCFAGKDGRTVSRACIWAGIATLFIGVIPVFLGVLAKTMGLAIPAGASTLMTVIGTLTNPFVTALVGCAVLAAILSTATSLINAISSNLINDFRLPYMKTITLLLCSTALSFSFYCQGIVDVMIKSYELSVSCLFVPILMALFKKKGNFLSGLLSLLFGLISFCFFREIASILLSGAGFAIGELLARLGQRHRRGRKDPEPSSPAP